MPLTGKALAAWIKAGLSAVLFIIALKWVAAKSNVGALQTVAGIV